MLNNVFKIRKTAPEFFSAQNDLCRSHNYLIDPVTAMR